MKKNIFGLFLSLGLISSSFAGECDIKKLDPLFSLMAKRNTLMVGVASYKFTQKETVYDPAREIAVLKNTEKLANTNKLNSSDLMLFAQMQMDQAKLIQANYLQKWKDNPSNLPDPAITPGIDSLRTQINHIDEQIYANVITNLPTIQICSQPIMLKHLNNAYTSSSELKTMATVATDYNRLVISALSNISPAGQ